MLADESQAAKETLRALWQALLQEGVVAAALDLYAAPDLRLQAFHPVNEVQGVDALARDFVAPLRLAFPDLQRRPRSARPPCSTVSKSWDS